MQACSGRAANQPAKARRRSLDVCCQGGIAGGLQLLRRSRDASRGLLLARLGRHIRRAGFVAALREGGRAAEAAQAVSGGRRESVAAGSRQLGRSEGAPDAPAHHSRTHQAQQRLKGGAFESALQVCELLGAAMLSDHMADIACIGQHRRAEPAQERACGEVSCEQLLSLHFGQVSGALMLLSGRNAGDARSARSCSDSAATLARRRLSTPSRAEPAAFEWSQAPPEQQRENDPSAKGSP